MRSTKRNGEKRSPLLFDKRKKRAIMTTWTVLELGYVGRRPCAGVEVDVMTQGARNRMPHREIGGAFGFLGE